MKKKFKSLIALILVIMMVLPIIASCSFGGKGNDSSGESNPPDQSNTSDSSDSSDDPDSSDSSGNQGEPDKNSKILSIKYLRIREVNTQSDYIVVRLNTNDVNATYNVRYSNEEITEDNFLQAESATFSIDKGDGYVDIRIANVSVDTNNICYIAVRAEEGKNLSAIQTVHTGGTLPIEIGSGSLDSQIYAGEVIRDFSRLFDEQNVYDPLNNKGFGMPTSVVPKFNLAGEDGESEEEPEKFTENVDSKGNQLLGPIVDLLGLYYVDSVYVYYGMTSYPITVRTSEKAANFDTESEWKNVIEDIETDRTAWTRIDIDDNIQYLQFLFADGQAPVEIMIYGYAIAEGDVEVSTKEHELMSIGDFLGICGLVNSSTDQLKATNVIREYHNFGWAYVYDSFPNKTFKTGTPHGSADSHYKSWTEAGLKVIPCLQWPTNLGGDVARYYIPETNKIDNETKVIYPAGQATTVLVNPVTNIDKYQKEVYVAYGDLIFQYAARYGHNSSNELKNIHKVHAQGASSVIKVGLGYIDWIELGNEPNGEDSMGYTPYQLAVLTSVAYDGHMKTVLSELYGDDTYFLGGKNADPTIKLAMAGLAGIGTSYIKSMCYWMRANRVSEDLKPGTNDSIAMDAFNVHTYFKRAYTMNGQEVIMGTSPEEYGLADAMSGLVEFRNKYYPDCEVWLTEFGWDTNHSYLTPTAAHAYGEYNSWQVQAMWLTRAYLILSAIGVDKATMYMALDATNLSDEEAVGQYGTCGILKADGTKKTSYYYLYTLKNTLSDYTFNREIASGNGNVWVYEYKTEDGKTAYAVWCPTSDGTKVENYQLNIGSPLATMVESVHGSTEGVKTELIADNGVVTFNVSENPVYILVD